MNRLTLIATLVLMKGCTATVAPRSSDPSSPTPALTDRRAIKLDGTGEAQACDGPADPLCNAQGPGQRLACDADGWCRYYESDDDCTYPGLEGGPKTCAYTACSNDAECESVNPDPASLAATCIVTEASVLSDLLGVCFFAWADCEVLPDTPCHTVGVTYCNNGDCACTAVPDLDQAQVETCNGADDDCDGETDNGFDIGDVCDGDDADQCLNGTYTCALSQLSAECVNEAVQNIAEACDGLDNDCDGQADEDFPTLGDPCDGNDADQCQNGTLVCAANGSGVVCSEPGPAIAEVCDSLDNDCDTQADEGCDDDGDGHCDATMVVAPGAVCLSGDCNDADEDINPDAQDLCDSLDNDCDGQVDEDFPLGDPCSDGQGVCQRAGTYASCAPDALSAVCNADADEGAALNLEVCNGVDDTCDGQVDEDCDDDADGWCDLVLTVGRGAICQAGDCDDQDEDIHPNTQDICDGVDNNCDGQVDEDCDDDADGWCDRALPFAGAPACQAGDCDDENASVNPGMQEVCLTAEDDNCDGDAEFLLDGVTPACDSCANALELPCGEEVILDMGTEPNAANSINRYQCWSPVGPRLLRTVFNASEIVVVPEAAIGTEFSLQITTPGTGTVAFRLHGSCEPDVGTSSVTAYNPDAGLEGTCARYSASSVSGGVVGEDFIALDAAEVQQVGVRFTCAVPVN